MMMKKMYAQALQKNLSKMHLQDYLCLILLVEKVVTLINGSLQVQEIMLGLISPLRQSKTQHSVKLIVF